MTTKNPSKNNSYSMAFKTIRLIIELWWLLHRFGKKQLRITKTVTHNWRILILKLSRRHVSFVNYPLRYAGKNLRQTSLLRYFINGLNLHFLHVEFFQDVNQTFAKSWYFFKWHLTTSQTGWVSPHTGKSIEGKKKRKKRKSTNPIKKKWKSNLFS